jgi:hypothetical protein
MIHAQNKYMTTALNHTENKAYDVPQKAKQWQFHFNENVKKK